MTFIIICVITLSMYATNSKVKSNEAEITNKKQAIYISASIVLAILIDIIVSLFKLNVPIVIYFVGGIAELFLTVFINAEREKEITKKHKTLREVLQCLIPVTKMKEIPENLEEASDGLDFEYDKSGNLCKITCQVDDIEKWNDNALTKVVMNLNKFLPNKRWEVNLDYNKLECYFIGNNLPPSMAKYPGSFLRPDTLIPLGVTNDSEVCWNLGVNKKEAGSSLFFFENKEENGKEVRERAKTVIPPKAPQCMVAGSTGGGKAIFVDQTVFIQ